MTSDEKQLILDKYKEVNIFGSIQINDIVKHYSRYYIVNDIGHETIKVKNIYGVDEYISKRETESYFQIIQDKNCPKDIYEKLTSVETISDKFIPGVLLKYIKENQCPPYGLDGLCIYLGDSTLGHIKFNKSQRKYTCFDRMKVGQFMKGARHHNMTYVIETYQIIEPNKSEEHQSLLMCYNLLSEKHEFKTGDVIKLKSKLFYYSEDIKRNTECVVLDSKESDFKIGFFNKRHKKVEIEKLYTPEFFWPV